MKVLGRKRLRLVWARANNWHRPIVLRGYVRRSAKHFKMKNKFYEVWAYSVLSMGRVQLWIRAQKHAGPTPSKHRTKWKHDGELYTVWA